MCEVCNKKFKNRANLKTHIKYEHDISFTDEILDCMISNCQECGKFSSIQQCENTLKTHIKQEPPNDLPSLEYDEQIKLIKDSKMTYKEGKCESCGLCNNKFKNKANLKKHINEEPEEITYDCHECGRVFSNQQCEKHIKQELPDDPPSHKYDINVTNDNPGKEINLKEDDHNRLNKEHDLKSNYDINKENDSYPEVEHRESRSLWKSNNIMNEHVKDSTPVCIYTEDANMGNCIANTEGYQPFSQLYPPFRQFGIKFLNWWITFAQNPKPVDNSLQIPKMVDNLINSQNGG